MSAQELRDYRKKNKLTQAAFAARMDVKTRTVVAWENGQNPVPKWVSDKISNETLRLNPQMSYETFQKAQDAAQKAGKSLEEWIADLIKKAVLLIILLAFIAKLMQGPTDWSVEALASSVGTGVSWFATGAGYVLGFAWQAGSAILASL